MNTINTIPARKWPNLRRDITSIHKATLAGTPSFERLAWLRGSRIYSCHYRELGAPWCDTMAIKDEQTLITEQNLQYFPAKVRFYYAQTPPGSVFEKLEQLVRPHLQSKQNDLMKHDHRVIVENNNSAPFLYGYRDSGTDILQLMPTMEEMEAFKQLTGTEEEIRSGFQKYYAAKLADLVRENKNLLHFNGYGFQVCTREEISTICQEHITRLCTQWKTTSLKLVKIPQAKTTHS